ncbi:MAG: hypothetical protein HY716_09175 [Planctomycetes bacterium]|nr:hypothetical protein [Planctomycetota bacterium]
MVIETDLDTFLAGETDRLRVIAFALRGLASDTGGGGVESKVLHASAGELEAVARATETPPPAVGRGAAEAIRSGDA